MMKYFILLMNLKMRNVIKKKIGFIKKDWIHYPILKLQKCLYEGFS